MKNFITSAPVKYVTPKFSANTLDRIVLLRNFARLSGVGLSLGESKKLIELNESLIETVHDFTLFVENVINSHK